MSNNKSTEQRLKNCRAAKLHAYLQHQYRDETGTQKSGPTFSHYPIFIHHSFTINGKTVAIVQKLKYLGVGISQDQTWMVNPTAMVKRRLRRLHFLRCPKRSRLLHQTLSSHTVLLNGTLAAA